MKSAQLNKHKNLFLLLILFLGSIQILSAQVSKVHWQSDNSRLNIDSEELMISKMPQQYLIYNISIPTFSSEMKKIAHEIAIPNPNGAFETFVIEPSKVVAPEVAHLYSIKTFKGYKKDDPTVKIACDISDGGFHAAVYEASKTYFVTPLLKNSLEKLVVYYNADRLAEKVKCQVKKHKTKSSPASALKSPTAKNTYRLAITTSGEYSEQFGGTPYNTMNVLDALASGVNIINPIYLRDFGIEFILVSSAALVFPDPDTDPYDLYDGSALVTQCHMEITNAIGSAAFDIGHLVIWDDLGGLADFGGVCDDMFKGEGYSGSTGITTLWVDYVCHEMGHQFGGDHNFASQECVTSESGHRYEPGEGSSIMSYADVCGGVAQYANGSDPFFHYASIFQIQNYLPTIPSCSVSDASGNASDPAPNAQNDMTIPKETPFILVGDASDANDPAANLTYDWEQYDGAGGDVTGPPDCDSIGTPLFRYRPPVSDKFRNFPQYNDVLAGNNNSIVWEKLPCLAQTLNFSLAVRDNNTNFGRVQHDQMVVTVANTGPFAVTAPNGGEMLTGNSAYTVTWSVNGTNAHCATVDILISTDGGMSYTVLADATANDGTQSITIPNTATSTARILVRCDVTGDFRAASTFYDVSNANFVISTALSVDLVRFYGERVGNHNQLNWETFSETNNKGFEVQRLIEGSQWETLSFIDGAGSSTKKLFYNYVDRFPAKKSNFYRLKQIDFVGTSSYSNTIAIENLNLSGDISFHPNPSADKITFTNVLTNAKVDIYDTNGKLVLQSQLAQSQIVDISKLASGVYVVKIEADGNKTNHKLIKN